MASDNRVDGVDVDALLRRALSISETPSRDLVDRVKGHASQKGSQGHSRWERAYAGAPRRRVFATVAVATILVLALGTTALAATGALGTLFATITGDGMLANDSRRAIVDAGFVAEAQDGSPVFTFGATLELQAYYADSNEIGLDFILSGVDIPDDPTSVFMREFSLEMTDENGKTAAWKESFDFETGIENKTFPGGHYFFDMKNNTHESVRSNQDFIAMADVAKTEDGRYQVPVIVKFDEPVVSVEKKVRVSISDLSFSYYAGADGALETVVLGGDWTYDIDVDSKFLRIEALSYSVAPGFATAGIEVTSVTVLPSVCRLEADLDFSKNGLGHPDSATLSAETGYPQAKYDLMHVDACAEAGGKRYDAGSWSQNGVTDGVAKCWFELDSMYFDAPETLTLSFASGRTVVELPLTLDK
ncbi:MAG: hypothetical protein LBL86_04790 [Coriobacteriales bacterium]|jgi:hypothetical protein|nr:hypothetical protein [Coriobacteriales bacterium]